MQNYELVSRLGTGDLGVIYKVRNRNTGEPLAMKCFQRGQYDEECLQSEIQTHRDLQHRNVIQFKEMVSDDTKLGIVMEYAGGGNLFDKVLLEGAFEEAKARNMFQQLVAGVSYIHFKKISHRDLKLDSTLLTSNEDLKICDFGLSKSSSIHSGAKTMLGTPKYWAPEVQSGGEYDGKLADIWSCGVTLHLMLTRNFVNQDNAAECINALRVSEGCKDLLRRMLVVNPTKRITIEDIKNHPWYLTGRPPDSAA